MESRFTKYVRKCVRNQVLLVFLFSILAVVLGWKVLNNVNVGFTTAAEILLFLMVVVGLQVGRVLLAWFFLEVVKAHPYDRMASHFENQGQETADPLHDSHQWELMQELVNYQHGVETVCRVSFMISLLIMWVNFLEGMAPPMVQYIVFALPTGLIAIFYGASLQAFRMTHHFGLYFSAENQELLKGFV